MEKQFLIATISSIVFYAIYYFFLRKESFHQFNRFYLLFAMLLSMVIPFIRIPVIGASQTGSNIMEVVTYIQLPEFTVYAQNSSHWNIANLFLGIYLAGVLFFTLLFIIKIIKISLLIIKSKGKRVGKYIFVEYDENIAPFSFFNYIFINSEAYNQEDREQIVLHEQIHVRQRHSWDLVFMEIVGILLWFNPILLMYKRSLQVIHEYMADHRVLQQGIETGAYLNLLLRQLTLPNEWMLGHHFNYLLTKNRFKMLKNHHYSRWALAKIGFVAPFIALLLMLNCNNKPQETKEIELQINLENMVSDSDEEITYDVDVTIEDNGNQKISVKEAEPPLRYVEEMPEPIGGFNAYYQFLRDKLIYPAEAREKGISGQVMIEFVVEKDGEISNVKVLAGVDPLLDQEALRVVRLSPKWKPGKQMGKLVRCFYQMPIRFTID
ncbi:MAG: TonB family protein [Bacteroidales bacterium]|jgi:TonB family protein|nr:TonB family protein [Bacteroidales bacterium]